jgi:hypothetical protein
MTAREMERKRKRQEVEYYERPPTFTQADQQEEAALEDMLFGSAPVADFGNELAAQRRDEDEDDDHDEEDVDGEDDEEKVPMNTVWIEKNGVMVPLKQEDDSVEAEEDENREDEDENENDDDKDEDDEDGGVKKEAKLQPAWEDEDDAEEKVRIAVRDPKKRKLRKELDETVITGAEYTQRLRDRFVPFFNYLKLFPQALAEKNNNYLFLKLEIDFYYFILFSNATMTGSRRSTTMSRADLRGPSCPRTSTPCEVRHPSALHRTAHYAQAASLAGVRIELMIV